MTWAMFVFLSVLRPEWNVFLFDSCSQSQWPYLELMFFEVVDRPGYKCRLASSNIKALLIG